MVPVVRLDGVGHRVGGEVGSDSGLHIVERADVARILSGGVGANAKRRPHGPRKLRFQIRLVAEQLGSLSTSSIRPVKKFFRR